MTGVAFCPSCGAPRLEDARFCGSCGLDIAAWEQNLAPVHEPAAPDDAAGVAGEAAAPKEVPTLASPAVADAAAADPVELDERSGTPPDAIPARQPGEDVPAVAAEPVPAVPDRGARETQAWPATPVPPETSPPWMASDASIPASDPGPVAAWTPLSPDATAMPRPVADGWDTAAPRRRIPIVGIATLLLAFVVVLAAGVGAFALVGGFGPGATIAPAIGLASPSGPAPSAAISPGPSASALPGTATPTPAPASWASADIQQLLDLVPGTLSTGCSILQPDPADSLRAADAIAAVRCEQSDDSVAYDVTYELLGDVASTRDAYAARLASAGLGTDTGGCWDGSQGEIDYSDGRVACWIDAAAGTTRVTWTFEPENVVASSTAGSGTLQQLVDWWWYHALLRRPATSAGLTPDQQYLVNLLPASLRTTCQAYDPLSDPTALKPVGSLGSIDCFPKGLHLQDVGWFRFTTSAALQAWYDRRIQLAGVTPDSGGCYGGTTGETTWASGRVLCYQRSGNQHAAIRWTDDGTLTYAAANADNTNLSALVTWWQTSSLP